MKFARNYVFERSGKQYLVGNNLQLFEWLVVALSALIWAAAILAMLYLLIIPHAIWATVLLCIFYSGGATFIVNEAIDARAPEHPDHHMRELLKDFAIVSLGFPFIVYAIHKYY